MNGQGTCFLDYDRDGHLDLYLTKYGLNRLNRNGRREFLDIPEAAGVSGPDRKPAKRSMGAAFADIDNDGDQDLYVANDSSPNFYYTNRGDGTFEDASWESGGMVNEYGESEGSIGLTVGDYNNDGWLDIFITNFVEQSNTLYENDGDNLFLDQTTTLGLDPVGFNYSGWGTKFFEFDNDGWLDLFVTNGHTDGRPELSFPSDTYAEPNYVLRNESGSLFVDVSGHTGLRAMKVRVGRGTAFADFDNDGDVDVLLVNKNDRPAFFLNDGGNRRNWLAIRTQCGTSNRDGIAAKAVVTAEGQRRFFELRGSDSYLSSNDMRIHVGLGESTSANVMIRWGSGVEDRHEGVAAGSFNRTAEGHELEETLTPGSGVEHQ